MKKHTKVIVLVLSLALLVGSVIGITASANTEVESGVLEIAAMNISYGDRTQILVAVKTDNAVRDSVAVTYTVNGNTKNATLHPTMTYSPEDGVTYPVFYTQGIAAKDMADSVKIEAHIGEVSTPLYYETSVANYFFTRLYRDNLINADSNDTENIRRRDLYLAALEYGAKAQDALVNTKNEAAGIAAEALVNTYLYVWSDDANVKVDGINASGTYAPNTAITPIYTGSENIYGFYLVSAGGDVVDKLEVGGSVTLTEHIMITPNITGTAIADYENGLLYTDYVNSYLYVDGVLTNAKDVADMDSQIHMKYYLADDPTGASNKVLKAQKGGKATNESYTQVDVSNENPSGNCYIFEAKIYVDTVVSGYGAFMISFGNEKGNALVLNFGNNKDTGKINVTSNGTYAKPSDVTLAELEMKSWFTIRAEFYHNGTSAKTSDTYLKLYVDTGDGEVLTYDGIAYYQGSTLAGELYQYVKIRHYNSDKASIVYFDDLAFSQTDKAYVSSSAE